MMNRLDAFLDGIPMYRLVRNVLLAELAVAALLGFWGKVPFGGFAIIGSAVFIVSVAYLANMLFARVFGAPRHTESAVITGLILALIVSPYAAAGDIPVLFFVPLIAIAGKYILAVRHQHVFNPVALSVVISALAFERPPSWWVASAWMLPVVAVCGFLIVKKIRRWSVVLAFLGVALVVLELWGLTRGTSLLTTLQRTLTISPLLFFASVMLTEPLTMPPMHRMRIAFAAFIGLLFLPQLHIRSIYFSPELSLVIGNAAFFLLTRRDRVTLTLREKLTIAPGVVDFLFSGPCLAFAPGQYMEWTLPHERSDKRGLRRYFTLASSPTEQGARLGVKFYENGSTFKEALLAMQPGDAIVASQRDGDFTLPHDRTQPCVFIAGGIGITPFRSIMAYLLDKKERRPITLFSAQKTAADIVYKDVFDAAQKQLGVNAYYLLDKEQRMPKDNAYVRGRLTPEIIRQAVPRYRECLFYLSGPQGMVNAYVKLIIGMGIPRKQIKTDYFPGFA